MTGWTADTDITVDTSGLTADGGNYGPGNSAMPNVVNTLLDDATYLMTQAGVLAPALIGYFGTWPILVTWMPSGKPSGTVLSQYPTPGSSVSTNSTILLTVSEYPTAVVYP